MSGNIVRLRDQLPPSMPIGAHDTPETMAVKFGVPARTVALIAGWAFELGWNAALDADAHDRHTPVTTLS